MKMIDNKKYNLTFFNSALNILKKSIIEIEKLISSDSIMKIIEIIIERKKNKIYVYGIGRSGLIARMFAMRLMHLNFIVHVIGDVTTPSISKNDLVIFISNNGETSSLINLANKLNLLNVYLIIITSSINSSLFNLSNQYLLIPTSNLIKIDYYKLPLGTLFEDLTLLILDSIIFELMHKLNINEIVMKKTHFNLE